MDEAALARVERQRVELEGQIAQLRKSLRHWQTLEIDYEGLKEEFSLLPEDCSTHEALEVAKDFAAELVDEEEIRTLFGIDKGVRRTPVQVTDLLSKRVDYVSKNALTIKKRLSDADKKRNALLLAKDPDHRDEAGLPLTEITEELDENGNVVSSKVETARSAAPQLMEVLKKAGVDNLVEKDGTVTALSKPDQNSDLKPFSQSASLEENNDSSQAKTQTSELKLPRHPKDVQSSSPNPTVPQPTISADQSQIANGPPQGSSLAELDDESIPDSAEFPTNPDDTEEDAALRREMLEYAHSEIGPIVAQLELEEGASDISYDENEDQFSLDSELDDDIDEDEESEDDNGQTKSPVISDKYRKKMEELEKRLGLKGMQNLGPEPGLPEDVTKDLNKPPAAEAARKAAIERAEAAMKASDKNVAPDLMERQPPKKSKKKVSFANDLDIAQEKNLHPQIETRKGKDPETVSLPPVSGSVIERNPNTADTDSSATSASQPRKTSRFKAARDSTPQIPPFPSQHTDLLSAPATKPDPAQPTNEIMSAAIKERPEPSSSRKAPPPDPYDFDEALHKQEIAGEYYKSRNRMIQRQGGFVREGEDDNYGEFTAPLPVVDEETGKVKKISRFKAARLT
jgi:unconventional prefoldin RPB5 interactor 1